MKPGEIYELDGCYLRCTRVRESGINSFQIVNKDGKPIPVPSVSALYNMPDYGIRLINVNECNLEKLTSV
jgi:hypothetical protein